MRTRIRAFDALLTHWIKSWPGWLRRPMLAITNSGQPLTVILYISVVLIWAITHQHSNMITAAGVVLATVIISTILKMLLRRARPETDYVARMIFKTYSFPSGHAAAATVGFGFLAYWMYFAMSTPLNIVLAIILSVYALLVGVSRVYLGAHYPSDVLGGIIIGGAGLLVIILLVQPFV